MEHREEVHEKVQRKMRYLLWNKAQTEEGGKWRNSSTEKPRKDGDLQLTQQESQMNEQAVRIEIIHQEEFLWQSAATWERLMERKKGTIKSIAHNEGIIAQTWVNVREGLRVYSVYLWHSEGWTPRNEALLEAVLKLVQT